MGMNQAVVSVVMPAWNAGATIAEAIRSIQDQTYTTWELIIVDDQSTDDTLAVASQFAESDPRVTVVQTPPDRSGSPAKARNRALDVAKGCYVTFLDADDIAVPERLALSMDTMRSTGSSVVFADFRRFTKDGDFDQSHLAKNGFLRRLAHRAVRHSSDRYILHDFPGFMLTDMIGISTQAAVYLRSTAGPLRFDETMTGGEDLDFFYQLVNQTGVRIAYLDSVVTRMLTHPESITQMRERECQKDGCIARYRALERMAPSLPAGEFQRARRTVAQGYFDLGYSFRLDGDAGEARAAYRESFSLWPSTSVALAFLKSFLPRRHEVVPFVQTTGAPIP